MTAAVLDTATEARHHRAIGLETIGMTKRFGSLVALEDVSIKVEAGTLHALLGENGAGKSTLVKCIMGFYQPTSGTVLVDDHEVEIHNPRDAHAHGIGMVYQHFTLVPSLTAAENLVISRAHPPAVIDWRPGPGTARCAPSVTSASTPAPAGTWRGCTRPARGRCAGCARRSTTSGNPRLGGAAADHQSAGGPAERAAPGRVRARVPLRPLRPREATADAGGWRRVRRRCVRPRSAPGDARAALESEGSRRGPERG